MRRLWRYKYTCLCLGVGLMFAVIDADMLIRHDIVVNYWPFFMTPVMVIFALMTRYTESRH